MSFLARRFEHIDVRNVLTDCYPLSHSMESKIRYGVSQLILKILTICVEVIFVVDIDRIS